MSCHHGALCLQLSSSGSAYLVKATTHHSVGIAEGLCEHVQCPFLTHFGVEQAYV